MRNYLLFCIIICIGLLGCKTKEKKAEEQSVKEITVDSTVMVKPGDFRSASWGLSKEQVKKTETAHLVDASDDILLYRGEIANLKSQIAYKFVDDTLYYGIYLISEKYSNPNNYITSFNKLKGLLSEKYGEPKRDKKVWKGSLYKGDVENYGIAVTSGELVYAANWETESTDICIMLSGNNFVPQFAVMYESKQYKSLAEKAEKNKMLKDL